HVLGARDAMMIDLGDVEQSVASGNDLHESAERDHAPHLALIHAARLGIFGDVADHFLGATPALAVDRGDAHLARILDVDLRAGLFGDALDDLAARPDDLADLVGMDLDDDDAWRER